MVNILMYISNGMIVVAFILYFMMIFVFRKNQVTKSNGFDITKDIISKYNIINVIESKSYLTVYNIKRKVIKLASKCYYGNDLTSVSLSLIEAGISVVDNNKNKYIELFRKIFSNLKILYIFPIFGVLINNATYNINDVKVSMILIVIFTAISYMLIDIKSQVINWISDNIIKIKDINENNTMKIIGFINKVLLLDKFIFLGELIIIIRFILILFEIV